MEGCQKPSIELKRRKPPSSIFVQLKKKHTKLNMLYTEVLTIDSMTTKKGYQCTKESLEIDPIGKIVITQKQNSQNFAKLNW